MDRWEPAYIDTMTTKKWTRGIPGVYFIRNVVSGRLVYIGMSKSCLYKALYRHFQDWSSSRHRRVVYDNRDEYEVRVIQLEKSAVDYVERRTIRYFRPDDNSELYDYPSVDEAMDFGYPGETTSPCPF